MAKSRLFNCLSISRHPQNSNTPKNDEITCKMNSFCIKPTSSTSFIGKVIIKTPPATKK